MTPRPLCSSTDLARHMTNVRGLWTTTAHSPSSIGHPTNLEEAHKELDHAEAAAFSCPVDAVFQCARAFCAINDNGVAENGRSERRSPISLSECADTTCCDTATISSRRSARQCEGIARLGCVCIRGSAAR